MALNLSKGESLNLTKEAPSLKAVTLGAGWDVAAGGPEIDLDLIAVAVKADGKTIEEKDFVFFGNKESANGAIKHSGDNRTGAGEGDDEQININLSALPAEVTSVKALLHFYNSGNRDLGMVANAFARVVDQDTGNELARYTINGGTSGTNLYFAELNRVEGGWEFKAIGECTSESLQDVVNKYTK